jgi:purine-binding chemotaxis protein CheW
LETKEEFQKSGEELNQLISFSIGEENYGVDIQKVKEVIRNREITRLPKTPSCIMGVINLRGDVIPILDLRDRFGLEHREYNEMTRVIVVEVDDRSIGMVVDSVSHVLRIGQAEIEPPPPIVGGISQEYLHGVGKIGEKLIVLLNIDKILTVEEKVELDRVEELKEKTEIA